MASVYKPGQDIYLAGKGFSTGAVKLDNAALIDRYKLATTAERLFATTGIQCRFFLDKQQCLSDIAADAACQALNDAGIHISAIDRIIVATSTGDYLSPSTAAVVQHKLGSRSIPCHDISAACSGFVYALDQAMRYLATGDNSILVIGADARSRTLDFNDANTAGLYGDGAGAFVLSKATGKTAFKLRASCLYADTGGVNAVTVQSVGSKDFSGSHHLKMPNGKTVMKSALKCTPEIVRNLTESLGLDITSVNTFIFHQPNYHLLTAISKKMHLQEQQVPCIFPQFGNTVAASIPMAFCQAYRHGAFSSGQRLMLVAIGAGFTGGGIVIN